MEALSQSAAFRRAAVRRAPLVVRANLGRVSGGCRSGRRIPHESWSAAYVRDRCGRFIDIVDLRLVEAEQVTTPQLSVYSTQAVDGIVFDRFGNPVEYHVLRQHPGDSVAGFGQEFDRLPADAMLHWFRADRPGQARGVPDIMPALPLFAQLRRFTLAVLGAARGRATALAADLLPSARMAAGGGPTQVRPALITAWAKSAFSLRNP